MIERYQNEHRSVVVILVECPICGEDLRDTQTALHFQDHTPAEFGLSPLNGGSRRAD